MSVDRQEFPIARSTLYGWLFEATDVLSLMWQLLKKRVLAADIVNTDGTPVLVQDPDRDHCRTGRIWVYVSPHGTIDDATPDRSLARIPMISADQLATLLPTPLAE